MNSMCEQVMLYIHIHEHGVNTKCGLPAMLGFLDEFNVNKAYYTPTHMNTYTHMNMGWMRDVGSLQC